MKLLANGNKKLKNMLVYSHTPIKGCLDCSSCASTCYAVKSYRQYPNVKTAWDRNLDFAKNDLSTMASHLYKQLKHTRQKVVRIHSSGDFISQAYVDMWADLIETFSHIKFYTYSKSTHRFDFSKLESLSNFNMVNSILPDGNKNYGSLEYCKEAQRNFNSFICPATVKDSKVTCNNGCDYCIHSKNVVFIEH